MCANASYIYEEAKRAAFLKYQQTADTYSIFLLSCYKSAFFVPKSFVTGKIKENLKEYLYINAIILS